MTATAAATTNIKRIKRVRNIQLDYPHEFIWYNLMSFVCWTVIYTYFVLCFFFVIFNLNAKPINFYLVFGFAVRYDIVDAKKKNIWHTSEIKYVDSSLLFQPFYSLINILQQPTELAVKQQVSALFRIYVDTRRGRHCKMEQNKFGIFSSLFVPTHAIATYKGPLLKYC